MAWVDRFRGPLLVVFGILLGLGLGGLLFRSNPRPAVQVLLPTSTPPPEIRVYVDGAVKSPGTYSFREGDRIEDALRQAGGLTETAETSSLNLAARLRDEQRLHVPIRGESTPAPAADTAKVNINTAPASLLDTLPGIGETYSRRIVDYRTQNGPFRRLEELVEAKLIPASPFDKIKNLITLD